MVAPTRLVCRPWAGVPDLPDVAQRPVALPDEDWDDLLWSASETLYAFSGRQFDGGGCASTVVLESPPGQHAGGACWYPVGAVDGAPLLGAPRAARWARGRVVVILPGSPVTAVEHAVVGGVAVQAGWRPSGRIWRTDGEPWPVDGTAAITYTHGLAPPEGGRRSAVLLALELAKAYAGRDCALPERVQSITREGVTVSMLDTFENLEKLQTGLYTVDLWLKEVNPHRLTRRPSAWSPDLARTRRT